MCLSDGNIKDFLEEKYLKFNNEEFIETDPIQIPKLFSEKENIEISGFMAATIAWGQRKTIINNSLKLIKLMDNNPVDFLLNAGDNDFRHFNNFKHRTFNGEDCIFFLRSLQNIYKYHGGLEEVVTCAYNKHSNIKDTLIDFRKVFFSIDFPERCNRHFSNVEKKSAAKRLNMFLRWMVRDDNRGVDFGIWNGIKPADLYIPLDVHSGNVSRKLGILKRKQNDWNAVEELTQKLRGFDKNDPIKYDFALFGLGAFEKILVSMANNYFEFKQFAIYQDGSAMKVGTDGVLLGAWADTNNKKHILDIGTGTGLIAIMAAQRNDNAIIDAIEIDSEASEQALENVKRTEWSDRINVINSSLQDFITEKKYDLIISNPPFFNNSTKAAGKQRTDARHTYSLPHNDIILFSKKHLPDKGILSLILPVNEGEELIKQGKLSQLYCSKKTFVIPKPGSQPKRLLLEFSLQNCDTIIDYFTSETEKRHIYTEEYKKLTKDFYIAF